MHCSQPCTTRVPMMGPARLAAVISGATGMYHDPFAFRGTAAARRRTLISSPTMMTAPPPLTVKPQKPGQAAQADLRAGATMMRDTIMPAIRAHCRVSVSAALPPPPHARLPLHQPLPTKASRRRA